MINYIDFVLYCLNLVSIQAKIMNRALGVFTLNSLCCTFRLNKLSLGIKSSYYIHSTFPKTLRVAFFRDINGTKFYAESQNRFNVGFQCQVT